MGEYRRARRIRLLPVAAVALALGACQTFQDHEKQLVIAPDVMGAYLADKPQPTQRLYAKVLEQGERNIVLNHMRAGLAAMQVGALNTAEQSFDIALERIEAIYADNEKAEAARSTFTKENIKDFKGEAYERAMAYYYRGLLYLMRGDYGNAQASFGGGLLQDTFAEDQTYQQDFASLAFLRGWAYRCQGSTEAAAAAFDEARQLHDAQVSGDAMPTKVAGTLLGAPDDADNILLVGESGLAPRKMATGEYKEALTYRRGLQFDKVSRIAFAGDGAAATTRPAEDIFWQAQTRGGRPVDHILAGKASFKSGSDVVGNVLLTAGTASLAYGGYSNNNDAAIAGGILLLGGLIAKGISAATAPDADLRQWDNLPEHVLLATARMDPATTTLTARFLDEDDAPAGVEDATVDVAWAGDCGIAWTRAVSALAVPDQSPESAAPSYIVEASASGAAQ